MNINGKNGLACITNMRSLPQTIVLKPLPGLPVIRDLIVDADAFFKRGTTQSGPYLVNDEPPPGRRRSRPRRATSSTPVRMHPCGCCSSACPSFWWNPDKYVGPAGLLQGLPLPGRQP